MKFGNIVEVERRHATYPGVVVEDKKTTKTVLFVGGEIEIVSAEDIQVLDEPSLSLRRDLMIEYLVAKTDETAVEKA